MLQRLTVAATLLVRHAGAYSELLLCDVEEAHREVERRLWAGACLATALIFAIATACLLAIAMTWDTIARLWIIAGLLCFFSLATLIAFLRVRFLSSRRRALFARTAHAWEQDRILLERLLNHGAMQSHAGDDI